MCYRREAKAVTPLPPHHPQPSKKKVYDLKFLVYVIIFSKLLSLVMPVKLDQENQVKINLFHSFESLFIIQKVE